DKILKNISVSEVTYPVINSKADAQAFIGLNMEQLNNEKHKFLEEVVKKNWPRASYVIEQTQM
ncbi:MAG: hypothetical protein ACRCZA_16210, partial [Shewanella sp.]